MVVEFGMVVSFFGGSVTVAVIGPWEAPIALKLWWCLEVGDIELMLRLGRVEDITS